MVMVPRDVAYAYAYAYAYLGASEMQRQSAVGPRVATILVSSYSVHTCVYSQSSPVIAHASLYFSCFVAHLDPRLIILRTNPSWYGSDGLFESPTDHDRHGHVVDDVRRWRPSPSPTLVE